MRNLTIVSILAGAAALAGLATCEFKTMETPPPFGLDIAKGQRLKLKPSADPLKDPVKEFETLLLKIDQDKRKGTDVNLKRQDETEDMGPTTANQFTPVPTPSWIGPKGSMHVTQRIQLAETADFENVIASLDTQTPTPTPTPAR